MNFKLLFLLTIIIASNAFGTLRIADYNIAYGEIRTGLSTVLQAIGNESYAGVCRPIDILILEEQDSVQSSTENVKVILNNLFPEENYQRSTINGSGAGGTIGAVYNTDTVTLVGQTTISGDPRDILRYTFKPVGYSSPEAVFYIYGMHLKASSGSSNANRRAADAARVRANADTLGPRANIIYTGDFNIYNNQEQAYLTFLASGNGQGIDPLGLQNSGWSGSSYKRWHTQAPSASSVNGMVGGGLDDRFDFQLISNSLNDNKGLAIINGSYHTFGNNGTHTYDSSITTGNGASSTVLRAMTTATDHCPVVADYQLPAKMSVEPINQLPASGIICPGFTFNFKVSNSTQDAYDDKLTLSLKTNLIQQTEPQDDHQWSLANIGTPSIPGTYEISGNNVTVTGTGQIPNLGTSDSLCFIYDTLDGDGELIRRLSDHQCSTPGGNAGLMIRSSLSDSASYGYIFHNTDNGIKWRYRTNDSAASDVVTCDSTQMYPIWLKIKRSGNTITGYYSDNAINWTEAYSIAIALPEAVYIGMAVAEYSNTATSTAIFDTGSASSSTDGTSYTIAATTNRTFPVIIPNGEPGLQSLQVQFSAESQAVENSSYSASFNYRLASIADFDGDFDLDINDVNLMTKALGSTNTIFDLDSSGLVDFTDMKILIENNMGWKMGDLDFDGHVNINDLIIFFENYLSISQGWENGNFNNDTIVNLSDFALISEYWLNN